jgi:2-polyprenyl-6-methoxyphenol hydroxylase-like FAD-dependent oxidoreductase
MSLPSEEAVVDAEVAVVGAGPVGCWLAAELRAAGLRVLVFEARENRVSWSRGFIVHPRTLEIFDSRGLAAPLVAAGRPTPSWHFAMGRHRLDFTALPTSFPYVLVQPQARTEELLEQHLERCGGGVLRGHRVVGLTQEADRVQLRVLHGDEERTVTARFVIGCDGARSTVREAAGIGFSGNVDTMVSPTALVELADPPPPEHYMQTHEQGIFFSIPLPDGRFIVSTIDHAAMNQVGAPWTAEMVRASLQRITGTDYGMGEAERVSTIGNAAKQAERYRDHRVLLAGDAAHVHFPMGGQGMNLGIQDAHNLAWRLIAAVRAGREAPDAPDAAPVDAFVDLLDGYEAERRPAGERVLEDVRAQMALVVATGVDGAALRSRFEALLFAHPEVNLEYARRLSGLDVRYPMPGGDEDPRCGARVPDLELDLAPTAAADGAQDSPRRLYELLREIGPGRHVRLTVLDPADADGADERGETDVAVVTVRRVLGPEWALRAGWGRRAESVLIRPDGHVVATGAPTDRHPVA